MRFVRPLVTSFVILLAGAAVAGDSVLEQIEAGVKAYKAGEYKQAITELNLRSMKRPSRCCRNRCRAGGPRRPRPRAWP